MKNSAISIFFILFLKLSFIYPADYKNEWVAWYVGQGQWITHITSMTCHHYDVGGEFFGFQLIKKKLQYLCKNKKNIIKLSHWDYDHYLHVSSIAKIFKSLCWYKMPAFSKIKKSLLKVINLGIPICLNELNKADNSSVWSPKKFVNSNQSSLVFLQENVLITGDSGVDEEKLWVEQLQKLSEAKYLVLGHHGSKTSTGHVLLQNIPSLLQAIASSRFSKYGHPHIQTIQRLNTYNIPLLRTEDWGNIWFRTN